MTVNQTKPEMCYANTWKSLESNPAAPINILQGTQLLDSLMQNRFMAPWERVDDMSAPAIAGKAIPTLPSVNPGINKMRMYYKYEKPYCETAIDTTCAPDICVAAALTDEQTAYLASDFDQCVSDTWTVDEAQFDNLNETPSARRADMLRRKAYNLKLKANKIAIQQLYASVSDYSDGSASIGATTKHVNIISSKMDISPAAMAKIAGEYRRESFNGQYVIFGGHTLADFYNVNRWRISPEGRIGTDLADSSLPFIYDENFDSTLQVLEADTKSHGISVPIGSFGIDFWNEFTGYKVKSFEDMIKTTIVIDGMTYDYALFYDKCKGTYTEQLKLQFGFLSIPDVAYCNGRALIKHWTFGCGDVDCDTPC